MNDYVNANKSKLEIVNDISVFVIFSMVDKGIQQVASLFFVKITSSLINNLIIPNNNIPYLPADRPHPRIGRTPNFQWFSWEKKIVEVEYRVVVCVVS